MAVAELGEENVVVDELHVLNHLVEALGVGSCHVERRGLLSSQGGEGREGGRLFVFVRGQAPGRGSNPRTICTCCRPAVFLTSFCRTACLCAAHIQTAFIHALCNSPSHVRLQCQSKGVVSCGKFNRVLY